MLLLFDFDGTLAQSLEMGLAILNEIAPDFGLKPLTLKQAQQLRSKSAQEILKEYKISPFKMWQMTRIVQRQQNERMTTIKPISGIPQLLKKLKAAGHTLGIVTSNTKANVEIFLQQNHITEFDFVHSEKNFFGKAGTLKKLIKKNHWPKDEVIYVGDEVRDIDAARQAGIKIISVSWGFNTKARLQKASPDFIVHEPNEILQKISHMLESRE